MSLLRDKNILIAVSGGIAAYKTTFLTRLFIKAGADVKVIMTPSAKDFVTPLSLSTLSKNAVESELIVDENWNNHVDIALWADLIIIAPATANTISKMVGGLANNLVVATYLSSKCPVYVAPAMDLDMYLHPSTKQNLKQLSANGNKVIEAAHGELASGLSGQGRMAEPEDIVDFIVKDIQEQLPLHGKTILISAGPTYEYIDPVRFLGNISSGKMGYALAEEASKMGADVILVSGPSCIQLKNNRIVLKKVISADEMYAEMHKYYQKADVTIMAAAVADYKPAEKHQQKMKKTADELEMKFIKTKDVLKSLGEKKDKQFLVGFALETENEQENAKTKLSKKNLDAIVLNSLREEGAGFQTDTNKISILSSDGLVSNFALKPKPEVANDILNFIVDRIS